MEGLMADAQDFEFHEPKHDYLRYKITFLSVLPKQNALWVI